MGNSHNDLYVAWGFNRQLSISGQNMGKRSTIHSVYPRIYSYLAKLLVWDAMMR
jgi:hypothetical protein